MSREKQIEEMAKVIDEFTEPLSARDIHKADFSEQFAEVLYNAGYRKQIEGEWREDTEYYDDDYSECNVRKVFVCSRCGRTKKEKSRIVTAELL